MNQEFVQINREEFDMLLRQMKRAERFCAKARPLSRKTTPEELREEPTNFYVGASAYAGATFRNAIQILEANL